MAGTARFWLIRHGETVLNRTDCFRGASDVELNPLGLGQAEEVGRTLSEETFAAVLSSDMRRAWATAEKVASHHRLEVRAEPAFRNIDLGPWNGRSKALVREEEPELWKLWLHHPERLVVPGAETLPQVQERAWRRLRELALEFAGHQVVLVSHSTVLRPLLAAALETPEPWLWRYHLDHASLSILEHRPARGWCLVAANRTEHLREFRRETI